MSTAKANSTEGRGDSVSDLQPISEALAESVAQEIAENVMDKFDSGFKPLVSDIKSLLRRRIAQPEEIERLKRRCTQLTSRELSALDMLEKEQEKSFKLDSEIDKLQAELAAKSTLGQEVYILLKEGDVIQEGDECLNSDTKWARFRPQCKGQPLDREIIARRKVKLPQRPKPIRFQDKMPEEGQKIFCFDKRDGWTCHFLTTPRYIEIIKQDGTHWLPQPPKPEAKEEKVETRGEILSKHWDDVPPIEDKEGVVWNEKDEKYVKAEAQPKSGEDELVERITNLERQLLSKEEISELQLMDAALLGFLRELAKRLPENKEMRNEITL